jgi:hypothetical protein
MSGKELCLVGKAGRVVLELYAVPLGADLAVLISGGDSPHIGAVALGIPRPSLRNAGRRSASVSLITVTGHKDDEVVRKGAGKLAAALGVLVTVSCGIHVNNMSAPELKNIRNILDRMFSETVKFFSVPGRNTKRAAKRVLTRKKIAQ